MSFDQGVRLLFLIGSLVFACASAQSVSLSVYPGSILPGGTTTLTLTYNDAKPAANVAAIQWQLALPATLSSARPVAGDEAIATNKVVSYNAANGYTIVAGTGTPLNATPMTSGVLATMAVTAPLNAGSGILTIRFGSDLPLLGADPKGNPVTISGGSVTLIVLSRFHDRRPFFAVARRIPYEP